MRVDTSQKGGIMRGLTEEKMMSTSGNVSSYPAMFRDLMRLSDEELPFVVTFPNANLARKNRLLWYGFRKAAEAVAEGDLELEQLLRASARMALRIQEDPFDGTAKLIFENRLSAEERGAWAGALMAKPAAPPAETVVLPPLKPEEFNLVEKQAENVLDRLGFLPKPQGTKGENSA